MMMKNVSVDYSDCDIKIVLGRRARIMLYHAMRAHLIDEIEKRGFAATDPELFNMITIEAEARSLADVVADRMEEVASDVLRVRMGDSEAQFCLGVIANGVLQETQEIVEDELNDPHGLITIASGTPLIFGEGRWLDLGQGPNPTV
jgi:hypothetical protein